MHGCAAPLFRACEVAIERELWRSASERDAMDNVCVGSLNPPDEVCDSCIRHWMIGAG